MKRRNSDAIADANQAKQEMKDFPENKIWAAIFEGVERYEKRNKKRKGDPAKDHKYIKRDLDKVHKVEGQEYLSKVVYIHPLENVTKQNSSKFKKTVEELLTGVIAPEDAKKVRCKWFSEEVWRKQYIIDGKALEFDLLGAIWHPSGTVAIYREAAIDVVNYVNSLSEEEKNERLKEKAKDAEKKESLDVNKDKPASIEKKREKAADPKKEEMAKAKRAKRRTSVDMDKAEKKQDKEPARRNSETKKRRATAELNPSSAENKAPKAASPEKGAKYEASFLEKNLFPFLKDFDETTDIKRDEDGVLEVPKDWPHIKGLAVHELPHTIYVTPPSTLDKPEQLNFGQQLYDHLKTVLKSKKCSKYTMEVKKTPETNYEKKLGHIKGVFRANLDNPKYALGTLMLSRGTLTLLVNHYRSQFALVSEESSNAESEKAIEKRRREKKSPPRKSISLEDFANLVIEGESNQAQEQSRGMEIEKNPEEDFLVEVAVEEAAVSGSPALREAEEFVAAEAHREEEPKSEEFVVNNNIQVPAVEEEVSDFDSDFLGSESDDEVVAEYRQRKALKEKLALGLQRKSEVYQAIDSETHKLEAEYRQERAERKEERRAKIEALLPKLREEQEALEQQHAELDELIRKSEREQKTLEEKFFKLKRLKNEKIEEGDVDQAAKLNQEIDEMKEQNPLLGEQITGRSREREIVLLDRDLEKRAKTAEAEPERNSHSGVPPEGKSLFDDRNRRLVLKFTATGERDAPLSEKAASPSKKAAVSVSDLDKVFESGNGNGDNRNNNLG